MKKEINIGDLYLYLHMKTNLVLYVSGIVDDRVEIMFPENMMWMSTSYHKENIDMFVRSGVWIHYPIKFGE